VPNAHIKDVAYRIDFSLHALLPKTSLRIDAVGVLLSVLLPDGVALYSTDNVRSSHVRCVFVRLLLTLYHTLA
jgi:hypothetical protein